MAIKSAYHTFRRPPLPPKPLHTFTHQKCFGIVNDLIENKTLPKQFATCDVFYSEMPFRAGFPIFEERARSGHADQRTYEDLLEGARRAVNFFLERKIPGCVICSKKDMKALPDPGRVIGVDLNGYGESMAIYGDIPERIDNETNETFIHGLASYFNRIGDFTCGYGIAPRIFFSRGKTFVASDYNPDCIGHLYEIIKKIE